MRVLLVVLFFKDAFMRMMEQDANDRYERRKKNEKLAMVQKDLGNEEFKSGNYEKAVKFYSEVRMMRKHVRRVKITYLYLTYMHAF